MDLQEAIKDLPEEQRNAILDAHTTAVEQERNVGISASRKKGDEVKKYMTETNRFKDTLKEHLDIDFTSSDDPIATIAEKLKSFKTSTVNTADYVPKSEFSKVKQQLADLVTREEQAQTKLRNVRITEALDQVMGDSFHGKDFVIKNLIASGEVRVDSDGGIVFVDGDDEMDLQKGVEKLKKTRPDMVKNISKPGAESSRTENKDGAKLMRYSDFQKLPATAQGDFMRSGGKFIKE